MNINNCFDGIIGVIGCHNTKDAEFWVNRMEGMSKELMDAISDEDQETFYGLYSDCLENSINDLKVQIKKTLLSANKRVRFQSSIYKSEKTKLLRPIESFEFDETKIGILFTTADSKYIVAEFYYLSIYYFFSLRSS